MAKKKKDKAPDEKTADMKQESAAKLKAKRSYTISKESIYKNRVRDSEIDDSSSESSKDEEKEIREKKVEIVLEKPAKKKAKGKKGKKKEEKVEEVDPGPGPGVEGVGEAVMAEIIRMREEAAAALAERLGEEEGGEAEEKLKKKKAPKKKGKKQKITAEMAEKMRKEAEEEAARLAEMERRRLEEERRAAIEKEKRETVEQQVRSEQLEKSRVLIEEIMKHNKKIDKKEKEGSDWELYLACRELPNASICDHMNTYLHLWEKDMEVTTVEEASKRTSDVMKLTNDLEDLVDVFVDENERIINNWKWVLHLFRDHQQQSLDVVTYRILRDVKQNMRRIDIPTADFDFKDDYVKLSIWLRVQLPIPLPNPRRPPKSRIDIEFSNIDISVLFPMSVNCENMAIRAMYLTYDHLSDLSDTFYIPTIPHDRIADLNEVTKREWRFKLKYKFKFREKLPKERVVEPPTGGETVHVEEKEDFASDEDIPTVPYRIMDPTASEFAIATDNLFYADAKQIFMLDLPNHVVNLRKFTILGGIYHLNLIYQPPQPQEFVTMEMDLTALYIPKRLEYVPFYIGYEPPEPPEPPEPTEDGEQEVVRSPEEIEAEMKKLEEDMDKLTLVTITWPQHVLFLELPLPCHWDEEEKRWSRKDTHDLKHNEEKATLSFRTGAFGIFGLATLRYANLPYQAWEIRPEEDGTVTFQLTAAVLYLEFHIKDGLICITVLKNSPNKALKSLMGTYYKFYKLKKIMKEAGVDIFPEHDAYCYVENSCEKHWPMESHLYHNMAELCNTFNFTWSRWNMAAGRRNIVLQMREYVPNKPKQKNYSMLHITPLKATYVDCTEVSQFFNEEEAEQIRFCADLYSLMKATCSITLRKKIESVSWEVVYALSNILVSTRVLSFS